MELTGAGSTSVVAYHLAACERKGLLVREPRLARTITLTASGRALADSPPEGESPVRTRSSLSSDPDHMESVIVLIPSGLVKPGAPPG